MTNLLIASDAGSYLLREVRVAVMSALNASPKHQVHVIVNIGSPDERAVVSQFSRQFARHKERVSVEVQEWKIPHPYYLRAHAIVRQLIKSPSDFWYLDGDVFVRQDLPSQIDADISMRYRPFVDVVGPLGSDEAGRLNGGVIYNRNCPATHMYWENVLKAQTRWHTGGGAARVGTNGLVDQEILSLSLAEFTGVFRPLDDRYNDSYFRQRSAVWHFKGSTRRYLRYKVTIALVDFPHLQMFASRVISGPFFVRDILAESAYKLLRWFEESHLERREVHGDCWCANNLANSRLRPRREEPQPTNSGDRKPVAIHPERHAHSGKRRLQLAGCSGCELVTQYDPDLEIPWDKLRAAVRQNPILSATWKDIRSGRVIWMRLTRQKTKRLV